MVSVMGTRKSGPLGPVVRTDPPEISGLGSTGHIEVGSHDWFIASSILRFCDGGEGRIPVHYLCHRSRNIGKPVAAGAQFRSTVAPRTSDGAKVIR